MTDMSIFEKAIGQLSTGHVTKYANNKKHYSCHAIAQVESGGLGSLHRGPMEEYARSWFNNRFEESGDYLDEEHYPEVFSEDPTTARRARIKQQYNRALWLTLLDLLYETGEKP